MNGSKNIMLPIFKNMCLVTVTLCLTPMAMLWSCGDTKDWLEGLNPKKPTSDEATPEVFPEQDFDSDPAYKASLVNSDYLIRSVNLRPWLDRGFHGRNQTIGILDNGFAGIEASRGKHLPPNLSVWQGPINNSAETLHGTKLAEVIFAMTSGSPDWHPTSHHPRLKLYNSNGFTNFSAAVDQAIKDRVDIIVYSQVWEFGGNFDGRGFINEAVNKATAAGILWINAAGNYAASSWQGALVVNYLDSVAKLPFEGKYVRMVVSEPSTPVKVTLSWNDFSDSKDWRTSRDLDLALLDRTGREIASSRKIQDGLDHGRDSNYSAHARETLQITLSQGVYLLRVDVKSQNFDQNSRVRLAANGRGISFMDQSPDASVMIPADNPSVLTVGASDDASSSFGQTTSGLSKPEVVAPSILEFESGISFQGSSSAAAVAAATLAVYREACGKLSREQIIFGVNQGQLSQRSVKGLGLWLPPPQTCF
jgi:hypothetical protein